MNDLEVSHTYLILGFIPSVFLPVLTSFSKARLQSSIVVIQSKTEIVQSIQIVKSAARINGETVSK